jgi:hypothetical protein
VAQNLEQSGQLQNYRINVTSENGMAWLKGTVASGDQAQRAIALALGTKGVERVMNHLEIEPVQVAPTEIPPDLKLASGRSRGSQPTPTLPRTASRTNRGMPHPIAASGIEQAGHHARMRRAMEMPGGYVPAAGAQPVSYDHASMPGYAWPSYAAHPNYAALTYPRQYSPAAWPYIGPFYPYPQVPLGWRKVMLEWDDGWWYLDFHE